MVQKKVAKKIGCVEEQRLYLAKQKNRKHAKGMECMKDKGRHTEWKCQHGRSIHDFFLNLHFTL